MDGTTPTDEMQKLEAEVRAARGELAATVDELTDWFNPRTRATAVADRGRQMLHDAASPDADPADRVRARVVLGVAAGAVAALVTGLVGRLVRR